MLFLWSLAGSIAVQIGLIAALGFMDIAKGFPLDCPQGDLLGGPTVHHVCSFGDYVSQQISWWTFINAFSIGLPTIFIALVILFILLFVQQMRRPTPPSNP